MPGVSTRNTNESPHGDTPQNDLVELYSPEEEANLDIVAVHGLNLRSNPNHARATWTAANDKLWLNDPDFLPKKIPTARILLFSYDSGVAFKTTTANLNDQANSLLDRMKHKRIGCPDRPVIFICHSLGGLLVKQALVNAKSNDEVYGATQLATRGIVFFGTPHRGGNKATLGQGLALTVRSVLGNPANDFMSVLRKNSKIAEDLDEAFKQDSEKYYYVSFFETLPMKGFMIVDRKSAILGLAGSRERKLPIHADHSKMCKFVSPIHPDYILVADNLAELAKRSIHAPEVSKSPETQSSRTLVTLHGAATSEIKLIPLPLRYGITNFNFELFQQLVEIYAETPLCDVRKSTLLELNPFSGYSFMDRESRMLGRALCIGATMGDPVLVQSLLNAGIDVKFQDYIHSHNWANEYWNGLLPPLLSAALGGSEILVLLLLNSGANINDADMSTGLTALHIVAYRGTEQMGRYLLELGASIESRDHKGRTPLHCATYGESGKGGHRRANTPMVELLMKHGAVVEALDNDGATPLHVSVFTYQEDTTKYLLEHGASVHTKRGDGTTVLDYLYRRRLKRWWFIRTEEIFCILLHYGALKLCDEGSTAFHNVVKQQSIVYVKVFLGLIPLHVTQKPDGGLFDDIPDDPDFKTEFPELAALDINVKDASGKTPLHYAALGKHRDILEALLEQGADPKVADNYGNTPLHLTFHSFEGISMVEALLENGADPKTTNQFGDTALHLMASVTKQSLFASHATEFEDEEWDYAEGWNEEKLMHEFTAWLSVVWDKILGSPEDGINIRTEDLEARNLFQESPLHLAAENGNVVVIQRLLDKGVSADLEDRWGCRAVDIATQMGEQAAVDALGLSGCKPSENGAAKFSRRKVEKEQELLRRQELEGPRWKPKKLFRTMPDL